MGVKDSYETNLKDYSMKVRDPTFKNNSVGMKGVFFG